MWFKLRTILEDNTNSIRLQLLTQFSTQCAKSVRLIEKVCARIECSSTTSSSTTRNFERDLKAKLLETTDKPWSNSKNKRIAACHLHSTENVCPIVSVEPAVCVRWMERKIWFFHFVSVEWKKILICHFMSVERKDINNMSSNSA